MKSKNLGYCVSFENPTRRTRGRRQMVNDFLFSRIENAEEFYFQQDSYASITSLKSVTSPHDEGMVFSGDNEGNVGIVRLRSLEDLAAHDPPRAKPEILTQSILAQGGVTNLDFSSIHNKLIVAGDDGTVGSVSLKEGQLQPSHTWTGHQQAINSVDVHESINLLVTSSHDGYVKLWDYRSSDPVGSVCIFPDPQCARFCPLADHLVMVSMASGIVDVWDTRRTKQPVVAWSFRDFQAAAAPYQILGEDSIWSDLQFSADGLCLLYTEGRFGGSNMVLYDVCTKKELWNSSKERCGFQNTIKSPAFCSKGSLVVYGGDKLGNCFAIDMERQQKNARKVTISQIYKCDDQDAISPQKNHLFCAPKKRKLDIARKEDYPGVSLLHKHSSSLISLCASVDHDFLYVVSGDCGGEVIVKSARYPMKCNQILASSTKIK